MKCISCSAPLAANTQICGYCGVRNDIDLNNKQPFAITDAQSQRLCPDCGIALQTILLEQANLHIERCHQCFGLFFDHNELETLLDKAVDDRQQVQAKWLENINREHFNADQKIRYKPCAVCGVLMNRVAFAYKSGVVVDKCASHGIWLSGGALQHLLEWKQAGGQYLSPAHAVRPSHTSASARPTSSPLLSHRQDSDAGWGIQVLVDLLDLFI